MLPYSDSKGRRTEKRQACCDADEPDREELNRFIDNVSSAQYRHFGICHLCTGKPSNLFYCSPMYGSAVKVRYGAFSIEKFVIAEGLEIATQKTRVRDILRVPRIRRRIRISETQLFRLLELFFSDYELVLEACPELARQPKTEQTSGALTRN